MKILLTGGSGFLGLHVRGLLEKRGHEVWGARSARYDLRLQDHVRRLFHNYAPPRLDAVIHLACTEGGGGIGYARAHPASLFYDTLLMNTLVAEEARRMGVKFVGIGSVCSYPREAPLPTAEDSLWDGFPEETNGFYGIAKKVMLLQTQANWQEFSAPGVHLILGNLYGPGDKYHDGGKIGHVIPATIMKCLRAVAEGADEIEVWGDGTPTRQFLYVSDAAEAIVRATERLSGECPVPINIVGHDEISIAELIGRIAGLAGFTGRIAWDTTKPNGQPRRFFSGARAEALLDWRAETPFDAGLARTVAWFGERFAAAEKARS